MTDCLLYGDRSGSVAVPVGRSEGGRGLGASAIGNSGACHQPLFPGRITTCMHRCRGLRVPGRPKPERGLSLTLIFAGSGLDCAIY
jgi:hypothetical protein